MASIDRLDIFVAFIKHQSSIADSTARHNALMAIDDFNWQCRLKLGCPVAVQSADVCNDLLMSTATPLDTSSIDLQSTMAINTAKLTSMLTNYKH